MAFAPRGRTYPFPAVAAFSNTGAVQMDAGAQIRIHNMSNSIAWVLIEGEQAKANAAAIPSTGTPTRAFSMEPGSVEVFQTASGNLIPGPWVNVCTPTDTSGTSSVNVTPGAGE